MAPTIPAPVIAPGAVIQLSGVEWAAREIMVAVAGPISEKIGLRSTVDEMVALHEAAHVAIQFLLGKRLAGASIVPWEGHSLGRASSRKPTPEDLQTPALHRRSEGARLLAARRPGPRRTGGGHRETAVLLLAPGAGAGASAGRAQRDLRPRLPADSVRGDAQGSTPFARRRGEGSAESAGMERGAAAGVGERTWPKLLHTRGAAPPLTHPCENQC